MNRGVEKLSLSVGHVIGPIIANVQVPLLQHIVEVTWHIKSYSLVEPKSASCLSLSGIIIESELCRTGHSHGIFSNLTTCVATSNAVMRDVEILLICFLLTANHVT